MSAVPAYFNGGPLNGEYRVLEKEHIDFYIPFIAKEDLNIIMKEEVQTTTTSDFVKYGRYEQNYRSPENGLYTYDWKGVK